MGTLDEMAEVLANRRVVVLSGAGLSTESGIPDYRGPGTLARARKPMQFKEFVADEQGRRRYWARSALGWPRLRDARPNPAHQILATLEDAGCVRGVITQNVDRLHHRAGSRAVIELHGALEDVRCLDCGNVVLRDEVQARIEADNPGWLERSGTTAPDGDVDLAKRDERDFTVPSCLACGGVLKPDVVFFGENVPAPTVARAWELHRDADALLVVGTSLTVFSGFRFVRRAAEEDKIIVMINLGETRGDALAHLRLDAPLGSALPALGRALLERT